nr:glycosyltransferase [Burkholderia multivorans]
MANTIENVFPNSMSALSAPGQGTHVSIVMRTKDRPVLLARAIASVLSQEHQDWHLYIVNDGGDKKCVDDLVEMHATAFNGRVTVTHHDYSHGMEAASNAGVAKSTGDFLAIHDDDDAWHPYFLRDTVGYLTDPKNAHYAAVISHCVIVYEKIDDDGEGTQELERVRGHLSPAYVDYASMLDGNLFPPISLLIRRCVADRIGGFNANLPVLGDWDYNLRILREGDIGVVPKELSYYYHRRGSKDGYGNSVIAGVDKHKLFHSHYTNAYIRSLGPGHYEMTRVLSQMLRQDREKMHAELGARFDAMWNQVNHLTQQVNHLLHVNNVQSATIEQIATTARSVSKSMRPMQWVWRKMLPVRHWVARRRGLI